MKDKPITTPPRLDLFLSSITDCVNGGSAFVFRCDDKHEAIDLNNFASSIIPVNWRASLNGLTIRIQPTSFIC